MLKNIAYNLNRGVRNLRVFEVGKTFHLDENMSPIERVSLGFAITGKERDYFWRDQYPEYDFFDIKGVVEGLLEAFNLNFSIDTCDEPFLNINVSANILIDGVKMGWVGAVKDEVLNVYDIEQAVYCAELSFDMILKKGVLASKYQQIPRFPQIVRDFSFYIDGNIAASALIENIKTVSPLITSVSVFDMFKKDGTSIAFRVVFQSFEDTLKDEKVNELQDIIIRRLTNIQGVRLRT